jgi:hypothetical protein
MRKSTKTLTAFAGALAVGWAVQSLWAAAPVGQYTDRGDGTVKDNKTALLWQQRAEYGFKFTEAGPHCSSKSLGGFSTGWRVPTKLELESLVDVRAASPGPTIDLAAFSGADAGVYWTSRPGGYGGVAVNFTDGTTAVQDPTNQQWVRCVR